MASISRRGLLLAAGTALLMPGCGLERVPGHGSQAEPGQGAGNCRAPGALVGFDAVGGAQLGYEITRSGTTMRSEPRFLERLELWAGDWAGMSGLGPITQVWSYGAYVERCSSFHQVGRAFDFAEVVHADGAVSCRFDTWSPGTASQLRDYWRLAASLHLHFAHTLTYLYNQAHHNHIHVDNSVSGDSLSTFRETSGVQVHMVQSALQHVFGREVAPTGNYDSRTRDALRQVQRQLGISRPLSEADGWRAFLTATASAA